MKHLNTYKIFEGNGVPDDIAYIIDNSLVDIKDNGFNITYRVNLNAYWGCRVLFIDISKDTGWNKPSNIRDFNDGVNELISQLKDQYLLLDYGYNTSGSNSYSNIKYGEYKSGDPIELPNEDGYGFELLFARQVKKTNEGVLRNIRQAITGYKKSDMYISENFPKPTVARVTPDKMFYGMLVASLDLVNDYEVTSLSGVHVNKGVFVRTENSWGYEYFIKDGIYTPSQVWFDQSYHFDKLFKISNTLGYKVGKNVNIIKGGFGQISEIIKFAFYRTGINFCEEQFTLLYKVGETYYQITQIELSKENRSNIVDDVIKENFYDLIDDETISYTSTSINNVYNCNIIVNDLTSLSILSKVTDTLSVAENRLRDSKISLKVTRISTSSNGSYVISFTCKPID